MAFGRLASHKSTGAVTQSVYQVPVGKRALVNVSVLNNSGTTAKVYLYISPTATPANDHLIQHDNLTTTTKGYERSGLVLKAGECLCYKTDQAGVNVVVSGEEEDSTSDDFSVTTLITTNTDTTIYPNAGAKTSAVNISVCIPEGSASDLVNVELYVTTTNVAGGFLIQKETLRATGITGFEKHGQVISATDKLILRTTGISGQLSTRVQGFTE